MERSVSLVHDSRTNEPTQRISAIDSSTHHSLTSSLAIDKSRFALRRANQPFFSLTLFFPSLRCVSREQYFHNQSTYRSKPRNFLGLDAKTDLLFASRRSLSSLRDRKTP